jgi:ketosteroid isomerase-like protein
MSQENVELVYRAFDAFNRRDFDAFPDWSAEPVEVRDLGNVTMGKVRYRGRGGESRAPADQVIWQVAEWRGRKIVRLSSHNSEVEALEAAGLRD